MSLEVKAQILDRIISLKDYSPFILICDSLAQTADLLLSEIELRKDAKRETLLLRDLNIEPNAAIKIQQCIKPGVSVIGVFHIDEQLKPSNDHKLYAPQGLLLLEYMATSILRIQPSRDAQQRLLDNPLSGWNDFSGSLFNTTSFRVDIEHRRKTGRSLSGSFMIDSRTHAVKYLTSQRLKEEEIPENLTTFNLALSEKQKQDKEKVELPFMDAQQGPGQGGAIVYQFEKDDDYDEEDPYEDPF